MYQCYPLPLDPAAMAHYSAQLGLTTDLAVTALAEAIALHPLWKQLPQGLLVARTQPTPDLAVLGIVPPQVLAQIHLQQAALNLACQRLRYVTYAEATAACEVLATRLTETFGSEALQSFSFCGIPRGGLIVLGMLAYTLGLSHAQMTPPYPETVPLVVVDDCALSGSRFARILPHYSQHRLIFAPLYAHPQLRQNLVAAEPQVLSCLSGQDLQDYGPNLMGEDYLSWQTQNQQRLTGQRYWLGLPDYLCFPWNEPDHSLWNAIEHKLEPSWRIIPPAYCLKNRSISPFPVQRQTAFQGWLRPAEHIVFGALEHQILIGNLHTGEVFSLSGRAAELWRAISNAATIEAAIETTIETALATVSEPNSDLRAELDGLIEELLKQKILQVSR
jgi:hypothetical protein